ncbi:aldo/keto reductase [Sphingomonas sp. ASY06-1R]|uniref:aldo/keto reductase n=1 Tax=Sphingomonas sp. ASY06-1R TaxID=3445771 RepID=UPI003FA2C7F0
MRYNKLGRTGLFVSELCLGTMTFGGSGDGLWSKIGQLGQEEADALLRTAIERGVNFVDTADVYADGRSEEITGQAIRNLGVKRDEIVVATKGFGATGEGPNGRGASRYHLIDACKASLKRLQLDHVDLYQVHGFDPATPMEETLRALDTLVQHGHVRYVGVSNWAAWQIAKALGISERLGLHRFASLQAYYTLVGRDLERDIAPMLLSEEVGLMVWSPLAGGFLSGKYSGDAATDGRRAAFDFPPVNAERGDAVIAAMRPIAEARGVSVARIALAWLLHQRAVTSVIVGAKRPEQLADNLAATEIDLTGEERAALDAVSKPASEYPGWMLERQGQGQRDLLAARR